MFAELLGRSCFSFLRGASRPEEMVHSALQLGLNGFALCDLDGMYGSVRAWKENKGASLHYIVGAELTLDRQSCSSGAPPSPPEEGSTLTVALLVQSLRGYETLCRLLSKSHEGQEKGVCVCSVEWFLQLNEGLYGLVVAPKDPRRLSQDQLLSTLKKSFQDRLSVVTYRHLDGCDRLRHDWVLEVARMYELSVVASARPGYHDPGRKPLSDVLYCIRNKVTLDQAGASLSANGESPLRSEAHMRKLFRDHPQWVDRAQEIAVTCRFDFSDLNYQFPCQLAAGQAADERLAELTRQGVKRRYPKGISDELQAQIEKELRLIKKIGVAPYFLSTHDVVEIARRKKILCQGRGSAANSAVCFMLGITAVDPSRSSLLFERFLSEERAEPPDIDIDFEHERREEVIQEIYEKYGRDRAAMVSEIISYRHKSALREVSRVFGLSLEQAARLSGTVIWHKDPDSYEKRLIEAGFDLADPRLRQVIAMADQMVGFPRHLSIHVGGFVLSSRPIYEVAPVEPARMEGRTVIPWDKDDIDSLGFFKVDVLALGMLTALRKTLELIVESGGLSSKQKQPRSASLASMEASKSEIEPAVGAGERNDPLGSFDPLEVITRIPSEDRETYKMISRGDTVGVFQIESRAQMAMLPRLRPRRFYDLVIEVAIVRPGPIQGGMVHPFLKRRNKEEKVTYPHIDLRPILDRTLGVPLFQEQVMQIAIVGAGYSGGEADQLRRDMAAWKKHGRLMAHREKLLEGFQKKGIKKAFGEALFEQIKGFGDYGFPESHASSFAHLVYASSWEKRHYPAHFTCALLNSQPMGFYRPTSLVRDAQAHGVEVRDVCVEQSDWDCLLEDADPQKNQIKSTAHGSDRAIRLGLRLIKGLGQTAAEAIVSARKAERFSSIQDLIHRTGLNQSEVETLAEAGALEALHTERRSALWKARAPRTQGLFEGLDSGEEPVSLPKMHATEQLVMDYGRKGLSVSDHPLKHHRARLSKLGAVRAADLFYLKKGTQVLVAGLVMARQRPATASGVVFVTLEDETGSANLIVYAHVFEKYHHVARHSQMLLVTGEIERDVRLPVSKRPRDLSDTKNGHQVAPLPVHEENGDSVDQQIPVIHVLVKHMERWGTTVRRDVFRADPNLRGFSRDFH